MHIFHNRPLALCGCVMALCAALAWHLDAAVKLIFAILSAVLLICFSVAYIWKQRRGRHVLLAILCLCGICGTLFSSYFYFDVRYAECRSYNETECRVEGVVLERLDSAAYYSQFRVSLTSFEGEKCNLTARVMCNYPSALQVGDRFVMRAVSKDPASEELVWDEAAFLADGTLLYLVCDASDFCEILPERDNGLLVSASKLNTRLAYALRNRMGGEEGGVAAALLLGNRSWLSDDTILHFRRAGISHLLALSGLHVSILIGFAEFLLRRLRIPKAARACIIPIAALGYLALTGFSVSTWRAVLMICVLYVGFLWSSEYDAFTALCTVLSWILLFTPYAVLDPSMWMSFLAAGSIIIFSPAVNELLEKIQEKRKLPLWLFRAIRSVVTAVAVGFLANLALLLYTSFLYGEISLVSVPATLLLSVPVTALLIGAAVSVCFPFLPILPSLCEFVGRLILQVAAYFSEMEHVLLSVENLFTKCCLVGLTAVLILLAGFKIKRKLWAVPVPAFFVLTVCVSLCVVHLSGVHVPVTLPAGHGEVRLYSQGGVNVVINDTRGNASEAYEIKLAASADYCTEVRDLVFCRYYNQATYFISRLSAQVKIRCLHLPQPTDDRERAIAARLEQEAALHGMEVVYDAEQMLLIYDTNS